MGRRQENEGGTLGITPPGVQLGPRPAGAWWGRAARQPTRSMTYPCDPGHLLAEGGALWALARGLFGPAARGGVDATDIAQEEQLAASSSRGAAPRPAAWISIESR